MNATEQYFPVVLFIMLYKVVLTFQSVNEILKCDHSNESYWVAPCCVLFIMLYKVVLTFEPLGKILKCDHSVECYLAPWDSSKSEYYSATFMVKLRGVIYMGAFDWSYCGIRIRTSFVCYKSLLPWFLDHSNSTYIGIFYFKQIFRYCNPINSKTRILNFNPPILISVTANLTRPI